MKKLLLIAALALCPLFGRGQATTGFHRVNQVLARAPQAGVTANVVPNATITVTSTASGTAATIYVDPLLGDQISPPVLTADNSGNYSYYIALNYCVTETITAPGQGTRVISNICALGGGGGGGCNTGLVAGWAQFSDGTGGCLSEYIDYGINSLAPSPNYLTIEPTVTGDSTPDGTEILAGPFGGGILIDPTVQGTDNGSVEIHGLNEDNAIGLNGNGSINFVAPIISECGYTGYSNNRCPTGNITTHQTFGTIEALGGELYTDTGIHNDGGFDQATPIEINSSVSLSNDALFIPCDATSGNKIITLDTLGPGNNGLHYYFVKEDGTGNTCTYNAGPAQTINGSTSVVLSSQYQSVELRGNYSFDLGGVAFWSEGSSSGGGGDTITSPNSTLAIGGTSSATTLDLAGAAGEIMSGGDTSLTSTPMLGVSGTATGTLTLDSLGAGGSNTITPGTGITSAYTTTLPANTGTVAETNFAQTYSAVQTFGSNISIGGVTATGATGTGNAVFSVSPSLTGTVDASRASQLQSCL